MGFRFRKSVNFGPLRVNLSKSGVGYSVGGKGFRVTKKANGGVRTTASIPGTGISYVKETSGRSRAGTSQYTNQPNPKGKLPYALLAVAGGLWVVFFILFFITSCDSSKEPSSQASSQPSASSAVVSQQEVDPAAALKENALQLVDGIFPSESISSIRVSETKTELFIQSSTDSIVWDEAEQAAQEASTVILEGLGLDYSVVYIQDEEGNNLLSVMNGETSYNSLEAAQSEEDAETSNSQVHEEFVWVSENGTKYHRDSSCSNMNDPSMMSLSNAIGAGYTACQKCY